MRHSIIAFISIILNGCVTAASSPYAQETRTVFVGERARELVDQCSRISPGPVEGVWTPTERQLDMLESKLSALIDEVLKIQWPNTGYQPLEYYRQYGGLITAGRQVIYVNGLHRDIIEGRPYATPDWRNKAILVCDGGPIVFGVEYDPITREFTNFSFNYGF